MDLSEEEMRKIIKSEKAKADLILNMSGMSSLFGKYLHF